MQKMINAILLFACFATTSLIVHWWSWNGENKEPNLATFALVVLSSYYILAFFSGRKMPVLTADLEKGKHGPLRVVLFCIFFIMWLVLMGFL